MGVIESLQSGFAQNSTSAPFDFYDMPIEESAFSQMEIMLSPRITMGNRIIVEALVEKFNSGATLCESSLRGLI